MALGNAVGGIAGGIAGGVMGTIAGIEEKRLAQRSRHQFTTGLERGRANAERQTYDVLNSPEFSAARNFVLGTFGMGGGGAGGAGSTTFGGQDYNARPLGVAVEGELGKNAYRVGRELGVLHRLKEELDTGVTTRGLKFGEGYRKKLEAKLARSGDLVKAVEGFSPDVRRITEESFSRYSGVGLDEGLKTFMPKTASVGAEGLPATATASAGPSYGPGFGFDSPLARDFRAGLAQAQTTRGLYQSNAAASAEASGLAALNFQKQQELLPLLFNMSQLPGQIYQSNLAGAANYQILRRSGGAQGYGVNPGNAPVAVFGQAAAGVAAGFGAGSSYGSQFGGGNPGTQPVGGGGYGAGPNGEISQEII